jgi:hypothetical protein
MKHDARKWKSDYDCDGYAVVEDRLGPASLATLRRGIEAIQDARARIEHRARSELFGRRPLQYRPFRSGGLGFPFIPQSQPAGLWFTATDLVFAGEHLLPEDLVTMAHWRMRI